MGCGENVERTIRGRVVEIAGFSEASLVKKNKLINLTRRIRQMLAAWTNTLQKRSYRARWACVEAHLERPYLAKYLAKYR
jgi:hypothetical protein